MSQSMQHPQLEPIQTEDAAKSSLQAQSPSQPPASRHLPALRRLSMPSPTDQPRLLRRLSTTLEATLTTQHEYHDCSEELERILSKDPKSPGITRRPTLSTLAEGRGAPAAESVPDDPVSPVLVEARSGVFDVSTLNIETGAVDPLDTETGVRGQTEAAARVGYPEREAEVRFGSGTRQVGNASAGCVNPRPESELKTITRARSGAQEGSVLRSRSGNKSISDPEKGDHRDLGDQHLSSSEAWERWANEDVASMALVPALVVQALATGLLDATTYADFQTFASNQTGNAIVLTLSAVGHVTSRLLLTGVSLGSFLLCAFVAGQAGAVLGVRRRIWLLVTTAFQLILLVLATIFLSPRRPRVVALGEAGECAVIAFFAGMSGAQVAMARQSSCAELPTAPMTSTLVDFVADHYLFSSWHDPRSGPRNRRVYYVVAMIGGSFMGAGIQKASESWVVVLIAVGLKCVVMGLLCVARADVK